ncbi:hypothetical protein I203_100007 [Kwoniella mangroviensis CBS 8507]|uniref:uncharacterized protein n=1 Tax=Kwoniella mangroviensis CBS 8507 TaxID=1296122 RepID=UPI00080CD220|nr:uncharacterized protein I203_08241 [Kwoniella mangroviensis CBS 8507]OCF62666.1 hypothetical protein I203_08241 [Kwoniella mangroviensis CBS 8507]
MSSDSYTQDDPRIRPIAPSRYPWTPLSPSSSADDVVKVSLILTSAVIAPTNMLTSFDTGEEKTELPCHAVLIEKGDEAMLFDQGLREDAENFPEPMHHTLLKIMGTRSAPGPIKTLQREKYNLDRLKSVIISHKHFDRPGSLQSIGPGYPKDPKGQWHSEWFDKYRFVELPSTDHKGEWSGEVTTVIPCSGQRRWERVGCFDNGLDWFGDGSFWLIDAPGHCAGHVMALCRVTAQPDTYVLLAGDAAHHQNMYLPIPTSECDLRSPKPVIDGKVMFAEDPVQATYVIGQLTRMSIEDNVMVLLAHEKEAIGVVDYFPEDICRWKEKGWKEEKQKNVLEDAIKGAQI